jgi:hypothetical protein
MNCRCVKSLWSALLIAVATPITAAFTRADEPGVAKLIDQLAEVGEAGIGFHPTAWADGFIAVDQEPGFQGGIISSQKPVVSPPLRSLVQKGVAALPQLIDHLSDRRETKLTMSGFMGMWHSDEYDPRRRAPLKYLPGPKPSPKYDPSRERPVRENKYTLRVGDLCFVAIGQIVNRHLNAVRYQPSGCLVINSPVETPSLAESVRKDWKGLTAEQHKQSLIRDALAPAYDADPGALVRLWFYFPLDGEKVALRLLYRPLYNDSLVWSFVAQRLVKEKNPARWQAVIDEFGREHGFRYTETIPFLLRWIYWKTDYADNQDQIDDRGVAAQILDKVYASDDPNNPRLPDAVEPSHLAELINAISSFPSRRVDEAIHRVYRSMKPEEFPTKGSMVQFEGLSDACVQRLFGRGYPDMILPYFKIRLEEFKDSAEEFFCYDLAPELMRCIPLWVAGIAQNDQDDSEVEADLPPR